MSASVESFRRVIRDGYGNVQSPIPHPSKEACDEIVKNILRSWQNRHSLEMRMGISLTQSNGRPKKDGKKHVLLPDLVVVFCGGKCGSSSLQTYFKTMGVPCVRIHNVDHFVDEYAPFLKNDQVLRKKLHLDVILTMFAQSYTNILVVDAYRDPIERKLSSFFQNFQVNLARARVLEIAWNRNDTQTQMKLFEKSIMPLLENRNGIDSMSPEFFDMEFDFTNKFQKMAHPTIPSVTLLKLRFHDISSWHRILSNALGTQEILPPIPHENTSQTKPYAEEYYQWRSGFSLMDISTLWALVFHPVFCKYHTFREFADYVTQWCKISFVQPQQQEHPPHVRAAAVGMCSPKPNWKDNRTENIRQFLKAQYTTAFVSK